MSILDQLASDLDAFYAVASQQAPLMLKIMGSLWGFNILNWVLGSPFNVLGIVPRTFHGLVGIFFSPFLHANFSHLFFNTFPLFALGLFILTQGLTIFLWVTGLIMLIGGFAVWLIGRSGNHIGASGVIAGYFGYLLASAYQQPSITTVFLGAVSIYYFGGIFFSLFPTEERISWEGHLTGFLAGLATVYILKQGLL
jgi:membrane associated rhomboid family serine protease